IRDYFQEFYQPVFREGTSFFSGSQDCLVRKQEVISGPTIELIARLARAFDAPTTGEGVVIRSKLPGFFKNWASCAYTDLLNSLPREEDAGEVNQLAEEHFRARVAAVLHHPESIGYTYGEETKVERRSMIDWCGQFGKKPVWGSI